MKLRRHIAFVAVLIASTVMFVHAVVPHHHRASDLAVCTETHGSEREEHDHQARAEKGVTFYDADCCCHCGGVNCAAPLPFTLRCGEAGEDSDFSSDESLPLFICDHCTGHRNSLAAGTLSTGKRTACYFIADARLISRWEPEAVSGRAPPVL